VVAITEEEKTAIFAADKPVRLRPYQWDFRLSRGLRRDKFRRP
jgi:hypothetical protein